MDGSPAPTLRAHLTLMAVPVMAGPHHVELRFDPPLVKIGLAVSSGMLLVTLGALAADWRVRSKGGAA